MCTNTIQPPHTLIRHIDSVRFTHRKSRTNGTESRYFRLSFFLHPFLFISFFYCIVFVLVFLTHICLMAMGFSRSRSLLISLVPLCSMNEKNQTNKFDVRFICVFVCSLISSGHELLICVCPLCTLRACVCLFHSFISIFFSFPSSHSFFYLFVCFSSLSHFELIYLL